MDKLYPILPLPKDIIGLVLLYLVIPCKRCTFNNQMYTTICSICCLTLSNNIENFFWKMNHSFENTFGNIDHYRTTEQKKKNLIIMYSWHKWHTKNNSSSGICLYCDECDDFE